MRVSINWLKDYVEFDLSPKVLADRLTMVGLEVGTVERSGNDYILELETTPNRGDCLSMVGIAREVSAVTNRKFRVPSPQLTQGERRTEDLIKITILEQGLCPRYTARIIMGVKIGPSPSWLKDRLISYGIRPVNNVVDVTNYVMLELGNPMHAFDYDLINGKEILIRMADDGEEIVTLEGIRRTLNKEVLVVADSSSPLAIAGIIGGNTTQVTQDTENLLLECAFFDPVCVRRTSRSLGLSTESSYRFERRIDPEGIPLAQDRAAQLITKVAGGVITQGIVDLYPGPKRDIVVRLHQNKVNKILGTSLTMKKIREILERLGFSFLSISRDEAEVRVPSHYSEITREIDIIEEIARLYGYHKIGLTLPAKTILSPKRKEDRIMKLVRDVLTSVGFYEIISFGFIDGDLLNRIGLGGNEALRIRNPISKETSTMRTTLIPGLLKTISSNMNKGTKDIKIFEIGRVFLSQKERSLPIERYSLGVAAVGEWMKKDWRTIPKRVSFYELSGVLHRLFDELGITNYHLREGEHPTLLHGRRAAIEVNEEVIGFIGELSLDVARCLDLPEGIYLFEIDLQRMMEFTRMERRYNPLPRYPGITRDLSILVEEGVKSREVIDLIFELGGKRVESVKLFDLYPGERLGEGYKGLKSLGYSILYRDLTTTLTDKEVNEIHANIIDGLRKRIGARLRG